MNNKQTMVVGLKSADKMMQNRVLVTVLQESLLKQLDNGAFSKYYYRFGEAYKK